MSWPESQVERVQGIVTALPRCATTTVKYTYSTSDTYRMSVRKVGVAGLKDGVALRVDDGISWGYVARGGTLMKLIAESRTTPTDAAFGQLLVKAVARLDAVAG
ncbi:hypothetical protein GCM10009804_10980 [Kribbella hippodromi]|uniref:Uncharacterized protein n=1 Tax=Kribbella hippodromi TaxID=434347 RepID=A0ABN2CEY1_9ACTN